MPDLSNSDETQKAPTSDALKAAESLFNQCETAWTESTSLEFPKFENIANVVFCGMGASSFGAIALKALQGRELSLPHEVISDYYLPDYVGPNTLVVLTSYSGITAEMLSCAQDAKAKEAQLVIISSGGPLTAFAKENNIPSYIFDGKLNPSASSLFGIGYTILGLLGLLSKQRFIDIEESEVANALDRLRDNLAEIQEQARIDAEIFRNKTPIILSSKHLSANAYILRNQLATTSKTFSAFYLLPDLSYYMLDGLEHTHDAHFHFLVLNSPNYSDAVKKRLEQTVNAVSEKHYPVHEFMTSGATVYDDFLETFIYGSFLTSFLSITNTQDSESKQDTPLSSQ